MRDLKKQKDRKIGQVIKGARKDSDQLDWEAVMQKQGTTLDASPTRLYKAATSSRKKEYANRRQTIRDLSEKNSERDEMSEAARSQRSLPRGAQSVILSDSALCKLQTDQEGDSSDSEPGGHETLGVNANAPARSSTLLKMEQDID